MEPLNMKRARQEAGAELNGLFERISPLANLGCANMAGANLSPAGLESTVMGYMENQRRPIPGRLKPWADKARVWLLRAANGENADINTAVFFAAMGIVVSGIYLFALMVFGA